MHAHDLDPVPAPGPHVNAARKAEAEPAPVAGVEGLNAGAVLNLQRLAGNSSVSSLLEDETEPSPVRDVVGSGAGAPLDHATRTLMESQLGEDFGDVRVHTGSRADESARSINAQAYTVGTDVVFRDGKYAPETDSGMHTLAHELTHVVQQKAGPVDGSPAPGGIRLSDPSDPFELAAERSAAAVMAPQLQAQATAPATPSIQRQGEDEEDETAQTLVAQRQAEEQEEEDQAPPQ